ncbi:MAG: hypothetical protein IJQ23_00395 [Clostridia bacterium]|nr:hypothetical protein [Clostridia bacterium]
MKNRKFKTLISLILSGLFVFGAFSACGSSNSDESSTDFESDAVLYTEGMSYKETTKGTPKAYAALTFEYLGGSDVMPIGGFYGPYTSGGSLDGNERANLLTNEVFKLIADAGVNMIVYGKDMWIDEEGGDAANLVLDLCENNGIGYFMQSNWIEEQLGGKTTPYPTDNMDLKTAAGVQTLQRILDNMTKNGTRKCVLGIHAKDEPFVHEVNNLEVLKDAFYNKIENYGLDLFGNSLGRWSGKSTLFNTTAEITYDEYLEKYFSQAAFKMFSATQYPFSSANTSEASLTKYLFDRLAFYRELAIEHNIPHWRMMQAGGQWNDAAAWIPSVAPYQNEAELLFDVNISLAYGAKAIQYFTLVQPLHFAYATGGTYDYERNGLIGANGNITRWYYYAQRANKQIQAIDEYLMNSASEGVIVHGSTARKFIVENGEPNNTVLKENKYKELTGIQGDDCVVGCFDYKGGTALYVVNYSRLKKADVLLKFNDKYRYAVIQRADAADVVGTSVPLTLDTGEGALIVLK